MQIIPRDKQFYDLFAQVASRMSGSAALLHELFKDPKKLDQNVAQIKTLEHEADNLTHDTIDRINRTFVTPFDVRTDPFIYLKDHLPDAVYLNTETLRAAAGGTPMQLMPAEWYAQVFARLGIRWDRPVVVYSAGETHNIDATFLVWLLASYGHPRVYLLDGGYFKWQLEERPMAKHYPKLVASPAPPGAFKPPTATLDDVRRAVERRDVVLVDARPPDQYAGEAGAQMRRGHIPRAISHYWQDDLEQEGFGRVWKPADSLRAMYAAQGITPDKRLILYCNSTTEASHVFFALKYLLGYPDVRIYTGAWTEWAERSELPIESGAAPAQATGRP